MVDYSKWDALEISDDSDIEVHPNVDKRSFIRAKQSQIHMERQQRKRQIQALKHERIINDTLIQRLGVLTATLQARDAGSIDSKSNPADIAFQVVMDLASTKPAEDNPPPRPEGVFDSNLPPLPTYSKILATILDEVNKTLDEKGTEKGQRHEVFVQELGVHLQKIQDLQAELASNLDTLEQQDFNKITSESYHVGFDSSHVSRTKPGETSKQETKSEETSKQEIKVELLNPNHGLDETNQLSLVAKRFAQIPVSDYRASHDHLQSYPELLQDGSDTDRLFIEAYYIMLDQNDEKRAWQYIHQAVLLQYCHTLGRDGVALFFKRITTPGHQAREIFEKDVAERFQKIRSMAKRDSKEKGVEQIQLCPAGDDSSIRIQVPPAESGEDEKGRNARKIFEQFSPEMRAALESASLDEVNKVLAEMAVPEAEKMVSLLDEAGCLSIEEGIIDATTEEGKRHLQEMEKAAVADAATPEPK
ncbi:Cdc37 N terminal kinase binding-domain-containing protein [Dichotomopilus funicola]|uniref:Hsp90 chaperone protein kinase-targeting subunit n=1 Tax=Dichotomopilus funicola TaxID=1934379 RepID=A0AAN6V7S5_9PEZI|nr:Cdc37 N terminal kinase binding-domain-containing protein [Dichotomopilus funicola]